MFSFFNGGGGMVISLVSPLDGRGMGALITFFLKLFKAINIKPYCEFRWQHLINIIEDIRCHLQIYSVNGASYINDVLVSGAT